MALPALVAALVWAPGAVPKKAKTTKSCAGKRATIKRAGGNQRVTGTPRNDVIVLGPGKDKVNSGAGDDTICGEKGADTINAGPGNDTILGGGGREQINGGDGDDTIMGEKGSDKGNGGPGNDRIIGSTGSETMGGGDGNDFMDGGDGADDLGGGPGDDELFGERGGDTLHGDDGSDRVDGDRDNDKVFGDGGSGDFVDGSLGDDQVKGGDGDMDTAAGGLGIDEVDGGAGNQDVVRGDIGNDPLVDGGPGIQDMVSFVAATPDGLLCEGVNVDLAAGTSQGDGTDRLAGVEDVIGSAFGDCITGDAGVNRLDGNSGDDILDAGLPTGGPDGEFISGGVGTDTCLDAQTQVSCGPEPPCIEEACVVVDTRLDGFANLSVTGSGVNNNLSVAFDGAAYVISEGAGEIQDQGGTCTGGGTPTVTCPGPASLSALVVSTGAGDDTVATNVGTPVKINGEGGSDNLTGGSGDDLIDAGPDGIDVLNGADGNDGVISRAGADQVNGGAGNDLVETSHPCDGSTLNGGAGEDNASFAPAGRQGLKGVMATLGGNAVIIGADNCNPTKLDSSNESLEGSFGDDELHGDGSNNRLFGQPGADDLFGEGGNDTINGVDGADMLIGGAGKDDLRAADGGRDRKIDCGPPRTRELFTRDTQDPPALNCGRKKRKKKKK